MVHRLRAAFDAIKALTRASATPCRAQRTANSSLRKTRGGSPGRFRRSAGVRGVRGGAVVLWSVLMVPVGVLGGVVALVVPQWLAADLSARDAADDVASVALALNADRSGPVVSVTQACDPAMLGSDSDPSDGVAEKNSNYVRGVAKGVLVWRDGALAVLKASTAEVDDVLSAAGDDDELTALLGRADVPVDADAAGLTEHLDGSGADLGLLAASEVSLSGARAGELWAVLESHALLLGELLDLVEREGVDVDDASPAREVSARGWPGDLDGDENDGPEFAYVWTADPADPTEVRYEHWSARLLVEQLWAHEVVPSRALVSVEQARLCVELMEAVYRDLGYEGIDAVAGYHTNPLGVTISAGQQPGSAGRWYVCGEGGDAAAVYVTLAATWESAGWAASQVWPNGRQISAEGAATADVGGSQADGSESAGPAQCSLEEDPSAYQDARDRVAGQDGDSDVERYPITLTATGASGGFVTYLPDEEPGPDTRPEPTADFTPDVSCAAGVEPASATDDPKPATTVTCEFAAPSGATQGAVEVAYTTMQVAAGALRASEAESCTAVDGTHDYKRTWGTAALDLDASPPVSHVQVDVPICHDSVHEGLAPESLTLRWKADPAESDIACATKAPAARSTACATELGDWDSASAGIDDNDSPVVAMDCTPTPQVLEGEALRCSFGMSPAPDRAVGLAVSVGGASGDTAQQGAPCLPSGDRDFAVAAKPSGFAVSGASADADLDLTTCDDRDDTAETFTIAWTATLGGRWGSLTGSSEITILPKSTLGCDARIAEPASNSTNELRCTHSVTSGSWRASRVMHVTLPVATSSQPASTASRCAPGTADIRKSAGHLAVSATRNSWQTRVTVCGDDLHEGDEQIVLARYWQRDLTPIASNPQAQCVDQFRTSDATAACRAMFDTWDKHTITIVDDDRPAISMSCSLADGSGIPSGGLSEGDEVRCGFSTSVRSVHDITLSHDVGATDGDTATVGKCADGNDVEVVSSPATIASMASDASVQLRLQVCSDGYDLRAEPFTVAWDAVLGNEPPSRATLSGMRSFEIVDDTPTLTGCADQALVEGQPMRCRFSLSAPAVQSVSVRVQMIPLSVNVGDCSDAGVDVASFGSRWYTISAGATQTVEFGVSTCADADLEQTEAFRISWYAKAAGSSARFGAGTARVHLTDTPVLEAGGCDRNAIAYEGDTVECEIALVNTTTEAATVTVAVSTGPGTPSRSKTRKIAETAALRGECGDAGVDYEQLTTGTATAVTVPARSLRRVALDVIEVCTDDVNDNRELVDITWQVHRVDASPSTEIGRGRRTLTLIGVPDHVGCRTEVLESSLEIQCYYSIWSNTDDAEPAYARERYQVDIALASITAEVKPCAEGGDVEPVPDPPGIIWEKGEHRAVALVYLCDDDIVEERESFYIYLEVPPEHQKHISIVKRLRYDGNQYRGRHTVFINDDDLDLRDDP